MQPFITLCLVLNYIFSTQIQYGPFIMLCVWSISVDHVISESCYKGKILQRNDRKKHSMVIFL